MQRSIRHVLLMTLIGGVCAEFVWGAPDDPVVEREMEPRDQRMNMNWANQINFDQYVFSSVWKAGARNDWRAHARPWMELELDGLTRECEVSPEQLKEIELAFEGELARFDVKYREAKSKWDELKEKDINQFQQQMWQIISPLQTAVQSHWTGETSLTRRTIRGILSKEQLAKYDEAEKARQVFANETGLAIGIAQLDEAIPMQDQQREELQKLLASKMMVNLSNQGYIHIGGMTQYLAQISVKKIEPIFTADQWKRLDAELKQHRPRVQIQGGFKLFGR